MTAHAAKKQLTRSARNRMVAGVAGGLAEYLGIDPVLVRLAFVAVTLATGVGIVFYLAAWLIIPPEKEASVDQPPSAPEPSAPEPPETPVQPSATEQDPSAPPPAAPETGAPTEEGSRRRTVAGLVLIGLGVAFFADQFIPWLNWGTLWPLVLVAVGVLLLVRGRA